MDDTAERIIQLGGTTQAVGMATRLAPYPADLRDGMARAARIRAPG